MKKLGNNYGKITKLGRTFIETDDSMNNLINQYDEATKKGWNRTKLIGQIKGKVEELLKKEEVDYRLFFKD